MLSGSCKFDSQSSHCQVTIKSDTVAVLAVLPQFPWYYRGNGCKFYGITAVLGSKDAGIPWGWGPGLRYMGLSYIYYEFVDCDLMHELGTVHLQVSLD